MDMKLFEDSIILEGNVCTPQGFVVDTIEYQLDGLVKDMYVLIADNPCIVSFKSSQLAEGQQDVITALEHVQSTRGVAQAVIMDVPKGIYLSDSKGLFQEVSNGLGLYDDNFLLAFFSNGLNVDRMDFAIQFDICGVACSLGVLRYCGNVYVTTDVAITYEMLDSVLRDICCAEGVFCVVASGQAGNMAITKKNHIFNVFKEALQLAVDNLS